MQSDKAFVVFRKFGYLHARVLLQKQDHIVELESKLEEIDNNESNDFFLNTRRMDENQARQTVLTELEKQLPEYGMTLRNNITYRHLCVRQTPF